MTEDNDDPAVKSPGVNFSERVKYSGYDTKPTKAKLDKNRKAVGVTIGRVMDVLAKESGGLLGHVSEGFKKAVLRIPDDLVGLDEDELREKLKKDFDYTPSPTIEALRTNFWQEFDRIQITHEAKMNDRNIFTGASTEAFWYQLLAGEDKWHMMAFIITMPIEYSTNMRSLLNLSTRRLRDFLNMSLYLPNGETRDAKVLDVILKAAAMVDMRAKGGYVQKVEQKNLTILSSHQHIDHTVTRDVRSKPIDQLDSKEIELRLEMLNAELAEYDQKQLEMKQPVPSIPAQYKTVHPVPESQMPTPEALDEPDPKQTMRVEKPSEY